MMDSCQANTLTYGLTRSTTSATASRTFSTATLVNTPAATAAAAEPAPADFLWHTLPTRPPPNSSTSSGPSSVPSDSFCPLLPPRLRRETRLVASSSMRAASCQEPVEEGTEVDRPTATSGSPSRPFLGEKGGEGGEPRSVGVAGAERDPSLPPYGEDEEETPAAAAAAEVDDEVEENADRPPDFFLAQADAETLFRRGVRALELAHNNIDELDQVHGLAGGLPAAVEARRHITLAGAELRQAFKTAQEELEQIAEQKAQLVDQLTDLNERLQRDIHQARIESHRQQDRARAAHQLRNNLDLLLHQARIQNEQQQRELLDAAPEIEHMIVSRQNAIAEVGRLEEETARLQVQNTQLEQEVIAVAVDDGHNIQRADRLHAELHHWHRMAVRLNNERIPEERYDLPNITHHDEADDPTLQFEAGHEFDEPPAAPHPPPVREAEQAAGDGNRVETQAQANEPANHMYQQDGNIANILLLFGPGAPNGNVARDPAPQLGHVEDPASQNRLHSQAEADPNGMGSDSETLVEGGFH